VRREVQSQVCIAGELLVYWHAQLVKAMHTLQVSFTRAKNRRRCEVVPTQRAVAEQKGGPSVLVSVASK
jgi:hypothetical protein